jgi:hypothetical protein
MVEPLLEFITLAFKLVPPDSSLGLRMIEFELGFMSTGFEFIVYNLGKEELNGVRVIGFYRIRILGNLLYIKRAK